MFNKSLDGIKLRLYNKVCDFKPNLWKVKDYWMSQSYSNTFTRGLQKKNSEAPLYLTNKPYVTKSYKIYYIYIIKNILFSIEALSFFIWTFLSRYHKIIFEILIWICQKESQFFIYWLETFPNLPKKTFFI